MPSSGRVPNQSGWHLAAAAPGVAYSLPQAEQGAVFDERGVAVHFTNDPRALYALENAGTDGLGAGRVALPQLPRSIHCAGTQCAAPVSAPQNLRNAPNHPHPTPPPPCSRCRGPLALGPPTTVGRGPPDLPARPVHRRPQGPAARHRLRHGAARWAASRRGRLRMKGLVSQAAEAPCLLRRLLSSICILTGHTHLSLCLSCLCCRRPL